MPRDTTDPDAEPAPPGSPAAIENDCTCPVYDNRHGRGSYKGNGYIRALDCPLHGVDPESAGGDDA